MIKLEPKDIGGIVDESFRICRENFVRFLAITGIPGLVAMAPSVLMWWLDYYNVISFDWGAYIFYIRTFDIGGPRIGELLFYIWSSLYLPSLGALMWVISELYLGRKVSVRESYRFLGKNFWSLTGSLFLMAVIIGSGFLLLIIPGFIFMVRFILTPWAVGLEGITPTSALARAKRLSEGNFWRMVLIGIILCIILITMTLIAQRLYYGYGRIFLETIKGEIPHRWPNWILIIAMFLAWGVTIFGSWLVITIGTVFYYDLRIRKEGFDLEMKAKELFQKEG